MTDRAKDTADFLVSLTKNDSLVTPIYNPEAWIMRDKARGAANRGEIRPTGCPHPLEQIRQFVDEDSSVKRNHRPVNLFQCGTCEMLLWFTDPFGNPVGDG